MIERVVVITDTSCFIILDKINALYLLPSLFNKIITTPEIADEYGKTLPDWVIIQQVQDHDLQNQIKELVDHLRGKCNCIGC